MRILVTGVNGQVGHELARLLSRHDELIAADRSVLDLASGPEVQSLVLEAMVAHLSTDILDTLRLGDIGTYVTITGQDITLGDLGVWTRADGTEITLGDIAAYLPASISLADVLFGLVPASAFPYEDY